MSSMRGLVQFIADLRNARARELEEKRVNKELANIRQKFKSGSLNGYQKKKYVCKLLYVYIQGYDVDFGHLEAVNLISSPKYSEKQIGYLAVTLFLHEQHELLHLVVNSIRKDLLDHNELNNCLALHAVANVGGREMGEALSDDVHRLLISPTSKAFVKKKAALTLLRLYRKYPGIVQNEWAERIISIMDDPDMGVTLSVTSLVMALVQDKPEEYRGSYVKAAQRLKRIVVDNDIAPDYLYYRVPCPWIQVKLLRLLQYYPPSAEDSHVREIIRDSLQQIMHAAMDTPKNVQQNNAQNAILFEAINLLIHLDTEHSLMLQISSRLGKYIQSRETNVRYLGLEAMTHFAARAETLDPIKKHQNIILGSLRDRDISVRRKGLDLIYSMCDTTNAGPIVNELLRYLQTADYAIREEMVLKVAILTEKYATDAQWYIDMTLKLLSLAGDHVNDEVWQRVIQIVTNNEELQAYAAHTLLNYLKTDCHESLVKIGCYVLGEFGHLIADNQGSSPIEQFLALQAKMITSTDNTRAMILSSFVKFVNLFPEIKPQLLHIFKLYSHSPDSELQQRAFEYLSLATLPTDDLLRTVCDEMPPFSERASILLSRLHQRTAGTTDKKTWVVGGKDANTDQKEILMAQNTGLKRSFTTIVNGTKTGTNGTVPAPATAASPSSASGDLAGLNLSAPSAPPPNLASAAHLTPDWEIGYNRLYFADEGVLFEDAQIQVGLRSEYRAHMGVVKIYISNKASFPIGSLTTTVDNRSAPNLKADTKNLPDPSVPAAGQTHQTLFFAANGPFTEAPTIRISYLAGALQAYTLQLPILMHRYMEPSALSAEEFFKRWRQIGGGPLESQSTFSAVAKAKGISESFTRKSVEGFGWRVLDGVDPNPKNIVGCAVYQFSTGKTGCLLRLEPNYDKKMYRITIRATQEVVPQALAKQIEQRLSQGSLADDL
ncbi:AP-2 complex subunit alpha [Aspergillus affinis]|uniref:AP-2 complex subunit alpha n=1 Tax=Aspergillus affinis TaxID=1070780 RepID=UPI0022FDF287|nr:Adaptor protein complex AP-2 alpha subunit [Aspergillus affinis]KAI9044228.1 Adaptor protein complex AP-2 alpha subunit [Aspergillus affinis]